MILALSLLWTAVWWALSCSHVPLFSEYSFFPLWLGYIFSINAVSQFLYKDSLLRRMGWSFVCLFVLSVPLWWFFEYLNSIVQNWHYLYRPVSELHYVLQSSISFSTVIPAVLSVAFLFTHWAKNSKQIHISKSVPIICLLVAAVSFILMPIRPDLLFPFVWIAPLLVIDPINYWLGFPSALGKIGKGQWQQVVAIAAATLFTGFFWEMWNFWSYPKWFYTIPYLGFGKVFEMPILGYGGYLPFGLIVWSYTVSILSILGKKKMVEIIK